MNSFELQTDQLNIRPVGSISPETLHAYLLENRSFHSPWEPARGDNYFTLEAVRARFQSGDFALIKPTERRFALLCRSDGNLIGIINFTNIVEGPFRACHLGFAIAAKHEGKGLMSEGLRATITFMFQSLELNRVMANFLPRNFRSARLLSRLGFTVEGFAKDYLCVNGMWEDHILTSVLRKDWLSNVHRK